MYKFLSLFCFGLYVLFSFLSFIVEFLAYVYVCVLVFVVGVVFMFVFSKRLKFVSGFLFAGLL